MKMDTTALFKLSYGMYIVSSKKENRFNGQVANTVFQVTAEPIVVGVSINKENLTHEFIENSGLLSISVLSEDTPMTFIGLFGFKSGRNVDKFDGTKYKMGVLGVPVVLEYSLAYLEARVIRKMDLGSHTLFIAEVVEAENLADGNPMTYEYYHRVKRGKAPKTAPTYAPNR